MNDGSINKNYQQTSNVKLGTILRHFILEKNPTVSIYD